MKSWPLEKIPALDLRAVTAIVQSITQAEISRQNPLGFASRPPEAFAALRWEDVGLDHEGLHSVTRQCNAMFHTSAPVPEAGEATARLAGRILAQWGCGARPVTFFTSGSTGEPKPCTHLESHLRQEVTSVAPLVEGSAGALVTAPLHHMYGFTFGLLLPLSLGIAIRSVPPLPTLVEAQMRPKDLVVGIPLLWTRLAALRNWQEASSDAGRGITVITATAPTPPEVMLALLRNGFRLVEFFGSSEVGVVCWRTHPHEPFVLLPHVYRGDDSEPEALLRRLPDGAIRRYPVMDNITWLDQRRLKPGARIDKAVQVGGVNVYPRHVAARLEEVEGVKQCVVRLMRPDEGYRLKAFVVPEQGREVTALHRALLRFARRELSDAQRPGRFSFGADIPRGPVGKPTDWS